MLTWMTWYTLFHISPDCTTVSVMIFTRADQSHHSLSSMPRILKVRCFQQVRIAKSILIQNMDIRRLIYSKRKQFEVISWDLEWGHCGWTCTKVLDSPRFPHNSRWPAELCNWHAKLWFSKWLGDDIQHTHTPWGSHTPLVSTVPCTSLERSSYP